MRLKTMRGSSRTINRVLFFSSYHKISFVQILALPRQMWMCLNESGNSESASQVQILVKEVALIVTQMPLENT